jgi:hypothetical protein
MYRRQAIVDGLKRLGYVIETSGKPKSRDDVWVTWNLKIGADEAFAKSWERAGGTVLVVENAYLQREDKTRYAISVGGHCGSGWFPIGTEDRFTELGFPLEDHWNPHGHVLVCGQRSIGSSLMASPSRWGEKMAEKLRSPHWSVRFRSHPGNFAPKVPLEHDLKGAQHCVIWSSSAGVRALTMNIPVRWHAPHWVCAGDEDPEVRLGRMAHGQWSVSEIAAGEPFARMRDHHWGKAC